MASVDTVAAFDFDGTLTTRDSLLGYLRIVAGNRDLMRAALAIAPQLVAARLDDDRRDEAKVALLREVLGGRSEAWLRDLGRRYADLLVGCQLRPDVVARLQHHQQQGHAVVIVSASPTVYLEPVGERLGVDAVLATELAIGPDGRCTGELVGSNCRRAEKVRRLEEWIAGRELQVHAYGDSRGDDELLARSDHPTRV